MKNHLFIFLVGLIIWSCSPSESPSNSFDAPLEAQKVVRALKGKANYQFNYNLLDQNIHNATGVFPN